MKVISTDQSRFYIFNNGTDTFDYLPCNYYTVNYSKQDGFYLEKHDPFKIKQVLYGPHESKVEKIINSYKRIKTNLGVILSGDKGLGKSLTARLLAKRLYDDGYPIIIINQYIYGIAHFLHSISNDCVILFDEFDKLFKDRDIDDEKSANPQEELLSLFDGIDEYHRLFIITANYIHKINEFFLNRPGRFQYHLIFEYPSDDDIRIYLKDNLNNMINEIPKIQRFSHKVPLSYDALRAICFELNGGLTFDEAIKDLNIINLSNEKYDISVIMSNGLQLKTDISMNMFSDEEQSCWVSCNDFEIRCSFKPVDIKYDISGLYCPLDKFTLCYSNFEAYNDNISASDIKKLTIDRVCIKRQNKLSNYHYEFR